MSTDNIELPPLPDWLTRYCSGAQQDDVLACIRAAILADRARQAPAPVEVDYSILELPLEALIRYCNNDDLLCNASEVIAAEAALETVYKTRLARQNHCQCPACKDGTIHASDCSVHNMPAFPNGPCDCGAVPSSTTYPPCKGRNCGATDGVSHSAECFAEHEALTAPVEVSRLAEEAKQEFNKFVADYSAPGSRGMPSGAAVFAAIDRLASMASTPVGEVPAGYHDELSREADGSIALDWITKDRDMLTMSLSKDGTLHWAIHRAGPAGSGKAQLNEACFRLLDNLLDDCEAAASPAPAAPAPLVITGSREWPADRDHLASDFVRVGEAAPAASKVACRIVMGPPDPITGEPLPIDAAPSEPEAQKAVAPVNPHAHWIPSADGLSMRNPAPDASAPRVPTSPTITLKIGREYAPFHPQASHVSPDYRDGWNDCYAAGRNFPSPAASMEVQGLPEPNPDDYDFGGLSAQGVSWD